ncbi:hypothetical protein [uncultured Corynebacterium sp.]|mgnify:CR=1 FL=1|uniref:hypothetical protein n=1 Tax=uncultured Corynebacterium sp. TaxID=159447 RepID=UPI0025DF8D48|nr:hypothetical protein [uncultured Corynebacterium sp.]
MSSVLLGWMMGLSPWLQVPAILAVATPMCAAAGYALLGIVDGVNRAARLFSRR